VAARSRRNRLPQRNQHPQQPAAARDASAEPAPEPAPQAAPAAVSAGSSSREAIREFIIESFDNLEQIDRDLMALEREPANTELYNGIFRNLHTIKGSAGFLAYHHVEALAHAGESLLGQMRSGERELSPPLSNLLFATGDALQKYLQQIENEGSEGEGIADELIGKLQDACEGKLPAVEPPAAAALPAETAAPAAATPAASPPVAPASAPQAPPASAAGEAPVKSAADSTIRVDVALLDKLMTRVGELVLARNQILQFTGSLGDSELLSTSQRLNLITTELQEGVMKTRMQPIGNVWSKFPRIVRDLSGTCGKQVRMEMHGKDPEGRLQLRAFHEGGQVNIEICDDGAGLHPEKLKAKAREKNLITQEQAERMPDHEAGQLIFLPGFSTAEKVSNVSGRGVGMDVVKTNIEKIGGMIDIQSQVGIGTTIKIKIPLTLAIIPALTITNDGNRFAIPQVNLLELLRLDGNQDHNGIEWIQGAPVYRLRGRLLPLVYLSQLLKTGQEPAVSAEAVNIVVLRADDRQFGLVVDQINDTEEIVVKPLSKQLKSIPVYSGTTIMGDGKVALILDVVGLAHQSNVMSKDRDRAVTENSTAHHEAGGEHQSLLILGTGKTQRLALPLSQVARLEKIPKETVERANGQEVVQYRNDILPLVRLANILGLECDEESDDPLLNVVVYTENQKSFGLVIDRIVDIVETALDVSRPATRPGLLTSAVIHERITDVIDLPAVIRQVDPS